MKNKTALVFGGSVFLGRAVVRKFLSMGYKVYVLNRGNHETIEGTISLIADRNNLNEVMKVCEGKHFDVVFDGSAYTPLQTKNAIESVNEDIKHFIHISSASVYIDEHIYPYKENSKRGSCPVWGEYSTNKFLCEEMLMKEHKENGLPVTILRPFYLYGIENNLDRESYIFKRLLTNQTILVPGMGLPLMQFGYIEDLCSAIEKICESEISCGKAYNLSGSEYVSFVGWIKTCAKVLKVEPKMQLVDASALGLKARAWFPFRDVNMIGDCSLIEKELGVKPAYSLEEGLREIVEATDLKALIKGFEISDREKEILKSLG